MKHQKGFTSIELIVVVLWFFIIAAWLWNLVKLTDCDFSAPYKCEAIHGVGLIVPPFSIATVWFETDAALPK